MNNEHVENIWLVQTATGRIRVKWRQPFHDEGDGDDTTLEDCDFDTEEEARAYGESISGRRDLEFRSDMEESLKIAARLQEQNPDLSPEEALAAVGFTTVRFPPKETREEEIDRWRKVAAMENWPSWLNPEDLPPGWTGS